LGPVLAPGPPRLQAAHKLPREDVGDEDTEDALFMRTGTGELPLRERGCPPQRMLSRVEWERLLARHLTEPERARPLAYLERRSRLAPRGSLSPDALMRMIAEPPRFDRTSRRPPNLDERPWVTDLCALWPSNRPGAGTSKLGTRLPRLWSRDRSAAPQ
jgi:hypothetical protein